MGIVSDYIQSLKEAFGKGMDGEQRFFRICELICKPISLVAIVMIPVFAIMRRCSVALPVWLIDYLFPILVAAAIGYLTNWIAIEMLFKPYERTLKHPFAWLSLGYWRQGLVPKNKKQIAELMGDKVAAQLLCPEDLARDLCTMVGQLLENKELVQKIRETMQSQFLLHKQEIVEYLLPKIEAGIMEEYVKQVTLDSIRAFWKQNLEPRLTTQEFRLQMAGYLIKMFQRKAPALAERLHPAFRKAIVQFFREKASNMLGAVVEVFISEPMGDVGARVGEVISDHLVSSKVIETRLTEWLQQPDTPAVISAELTEMCTGVGDFVGSPDSASYLEGFATDMGEAFRKMLRSWLNEHLAAKIEGILASQELWDWGTSLLVNSREQLEVFMREQGMPMIIEKLNIQGRIRQAVDKQDMVQFHDMVNQVVAQHLGAIQVLGFILGGIAGTLLTVFC